VSVDLYVEITPPAEVIVGAILGFSTQITTFREPLTRAVEKVAAPSLSQNFDVGGRPAWEPLAEGTTAQKVGGEILIETGELQRFAGSLDAWTIGGDQAAIEGLPENVGYGTFHQAGTWKMPARPWAELQEEDLVAIDDIFALWFEEKLVELGFVSSETEDLGG